MGWELYENGKRLCKVQDLRIINGNQNYERIRSFGSPDEVVPTTKDPDEAVFTSEVFPNMHNAHELREAGSGKVLRIMITKISGRLVNALIQP